MPKCLTCKTQFHACGSCYYDKSWEYQYCSEECWRNSEEYREVQSAYSKLFVEIDPKLKEYFDFLFNEVNMEDYPQSERDRWVDKISERKE